MQTSKIYSPNIKVNDKKFLYKYIWSFSLGDGGLYRDKRSPNGNARFQATQLAIHRDYIEWRANILANITNIRLSEGILTSSTRNNKPTITTVSQTHPIFTDIHARLYLNNVKRIDPHQLKYLDAETLAILYQDDGSLGFGWPGLGHGDYYRPRISIATYNFTYGDVFTLAKAIYEKTGLHWNLHRKKTKSGKIHWILSLKGSNIYNFIKTVEPYIKPSFYYKIDLSRANISDYYKSEGDIVQTIQ